MHANRFYKDTGLKWLSLSKLIHSLKYKGGNFFSYNTWLPGKNITYARLMSYITWQVQLVQYVLPSLFQSLLNCILYILSRCSFLFGDWYS